jgi:hypothetical protein
MRPMIDDLELVQVQEVHTADRRMLAEHRPPGFDGSLLQNLGRSSTVVTVRGVATGADASDFVEKLDGKFRAGDSVGFTADIAADAGIQQLLIHDLAVDELAGRPQRFGYTLTMREHLEPTETEDTTGLDADILDEAGDLSGDLIDGLAAVQGFATGLERFLPQLSELLERLQHFSKSLGT